MIVAIATDFYKEHIYNDDSFNKGGRMMKVIKRDGRAVEYERKKIELAIEKANNEVRGREKATKEEIKNIVSYIEDLGKKRILVEDIQDIIEEQLMRNR